MSRTTLAVVLVAACAAEPGPAPPADVCDEIRAELPGVLAAAQTPGAIVAFEQPGQPLCVVAAGYSDAKAGVLASPEQHYHIGSSTKTFIAAATLLLADDGAFVGKESLHDWLPGIVANSEAIGIVHLLTNTSGIPNYLEVIKSDPTRYDVTKPITREEIIAISQTVAPRFAPGSQFEYSNTGWILLGMVIERASGKPWGQFVRERLLEPQGLRATYVDRFALPAGAPMMRSWGPYQGAEIDITELGHPTWADAAGSMVSTVEDMARWTSALYGGRVVSGEGLAVMMKPAITIGGDVGYSIGTITKPTRFGTWTGHGGDWVGSRTYLGGLPARGMFLQVATNYIDSDRFAVADVAWDAALGDGLGSLSPFVGR